RAVVGAMIEDWLRGAGVEVVDSMELDSLEAIASMVHAGLGVSIVPRQCVPPPNPLPLCRIPLAPAATRDLGLVSLAATVKTRVLEELASRLGEVVAQDAL
ncbi:MAG: LysR substrate-binding domain-containing protein, partial [Pseudomonadota bacterium]